MTNPTPLGVRVTPPGPFHWRSGVPVTPSGRVTEQVRVTDSPATTEEDGDEVREMVAGSVERFVFLLLASGSEPYYTRYDLRDFSRATF